MGFFDKLFGGSKVSEEVKSSAAPFKVSLVFSPFRITAMKQGSANLVIKITNNTNEKQLVSVEALLPRHVLVGFDPTAINKYIDKKLGELEPGETKEIAISVWGTNQTKAGDYPVEVTIYSHYIDYTKVLNYMKKKTVLRVV